MYIVFDDSHGWCEVFPDIQALRAWLKRYIEDDEGDISLFSIYKLGESYKAISKTAITITITKETK